MRAAWSLLFMAPLAFAAGDANRGAQVFGQCIACHSVRPAEHMTGPSLAHVFNRKAGTAEGFMRYSDALKGAAITWNEAALDKWLANPGKLVRGTTMTYAGMKASQARQDLIAYLKAVDENKAPAAARGGHGMMGMQREKPDLKNVPLAEQVRSITHCGDTYTVQTGDRKVEKVWEFNLRFKTDTSKRGPAPGKPVAVGAGMQGDRASIVFASPEEISKSIRHDCQTPGNDAPPAAFAPNEGIVRGVDNAAAEIVIRHGPLTEIDMPPMTMAFEVKDASLLDKVKAGDRVTFRVELLNGRFTVTSIQPLRGTRP